MAAAAKEHAVCQVCWVALVAALVLVLAESNFELVLPSVVVLRVQASAAAAAAAAAAAVAALLAGWSAADVH